MCPDIALVNARIHTLEAKLREVSALAIRNERISAAGTDSEIEELADTRTEVIDLRGRLVLPGLVDAHCHFEQFARTRTQIDAGQTSKQLSSREHLVVLGWSQLCKLSLDFGNSLPVTGHR